MNPSDQKWQRLVAAARRAEPGEVVAPYGFATRVAARACELPVVAGSLLEHFSLRALGVAALLAVVCLAGSYSTLVSAFDNDAAGVDDPVAEVVDLAS